MLLLLLVGCRICLVRRRIDQVDAIATATAEEHHSDNHMETEMETETETETGMETVTDGTPAMN